MMLYRFMRYPGGKTKAVTFSYDDGSVHDIRLADTLTQYGIKGTFNLCKIRPAVSYDTWHMSKHEIQKHIITPGHEIAVHGQNHQAPVHVSPTEGIVDILNCRLELEKTFGRIVRGMAYPDSGIRKRFVTGYDTIKSYVQDLGIVYARTAGEDNNGFCLPQDWFAWAPTAVHTNPAVFSYIDEFTKLDVNRLYCSSRFPRLFYLWGHSFSFDGDKNWDRLESICEKLASHEDTWYATNLEIYDYVNAYHSLQVSADAKRIYNPSLFSVWFRYEDCDYTVLPGETLLLP